MTAEDIQVALDKKEMVRVKQKRCLLCSKYRELLFPMIIKVNQKTFDIIKDSVNEDTNFEIVVETVHVPVIDAVLDDITLKLIDGKAYQISLDMCKGCLSRIAYRHKYKKPNPFATA